MTQGDQPGDFSDVFKRDDSDMGADSAAPVESGQPRDESGRFAPKSEAPKAEAAPEAQPNAQPQATPPQIDTPPEQQPRHVPLPELLSEREKRKQEATRREEAEKRAAAVEAQFEALQRQLQMMQQPRQQEQPPDPWSDPQGALAYQRAQIEAMLSDQRAEMSERFARQQYGNDAVNAALEACKRAGEDARRYFSQQRDPYDALVKWHRQSSFLQKVGTDPDAYEKTIQQKAYEQALADLRAGKVLPGQGASSAAPAAPQRFPGSLASATATGSQAAVLTDEAAFSDVFARRN